MPAQETGGDCHDKINTPNPSRANTFPPWLPNIFQTMKHLNSSVLVFFAKFISFGFFENFHHTQPTMAVGWLHLRCQPRPLRLAALLASAWPPCHRWCSPQSACRTPPTPTLPLPLKPRPLRVDLRSTLMFCQCTQTNWFSPSVVSTRFRFKARV